MIFQIVFHHLLEIKHCGTFFFFFFFQETSQIAEVLIPSFRSKMLVAAQPQNL